MKRDAEAVKLALKWFDENNPFNYDRDKQLLVSFSSGFTSTAEVNAERSTEIQEIRRQMQIKLDGQPVTSIMGVKLKVQAFSSLRKISKVSDRKIHLNSVKLFSRLIMFAQREMAVETSYEYELTSCRLQYHCSAAKGHTINKAGTGCFCRICL